MITWKEACDQVGYDELATGPKVEYKYFAYKGGKVTEFAQEIDAYAFSQMVEAEPIPLSMEEKDAWIAEADRLEVAAVDVWFALLEQEYKHLPAPVFKLCYEQAYQEAHPYGYDEIAKNMAGIVDFAARLVKLMQHDKS